MAIEQIIVDLKDEAKKYLVDNASKVSDSVATEKYITVCYAKEPDGTVTTGIELIKYTDSKEEKGIYEIAQHISFGEKIDIIHKCLIVGDPNKGELIGAWTDEEAQKNYDEYLGK